MIFVLHCNINRVLIKNKMKCESNSTSTKMIINISSEERVKEDLDPSSITTDYEVSVNAKKTDVRIEKTASISIVVTEAIESEQIGGSNSSQNLLASNKIDIIKEDENRVDEDERGASDLPPGSTEVKMIGSLGLLSQYASSSDETDDAEDENSNSDGTKCSHDSKKSKNKAKLLAKCILGNSISQGTYRGVNVQTYVY